MDLKTETEFLAKTSNCIEATFKFPFRTSSEANIAFNSLRIDKEPARGGVSKEFLVEKNFLFVKISSSDVRRLRSAITSFFDFLILVVKTISRFG